jgi:hypothetical protein
MTHFELLDETMVHNGVTLHRIGLTKDHPRGPKGTKGGWVESIHNISDNSWVGGEGKVYGNARLIGKSRVTGHAQVYGNAVVIDAGVCNSAQVFDNAVIIGALFKETIGGNAKVYGCARVIYPSVYGNVEIFDNAVVVDTHLTGNVKIYGNSYIANQLSVFESDLKRYGASYGAGEQAVRDNDILDGAIMVRPSYEHRDKEPVVHAIYDQSPLNQNYIRRQEALYGNGWHSGL